MYMYIEEFEKKIIMPLYDEIPGIKFKFIFIQCTCINGQKTISFTKVPSNVYVCNTCNSRNVITSLSRILYEKILSK